MTEVQKFIFNTNYSSSAENIKKIQEKKFSDARTLLAQEIEQAKQNAYNQGVQQGEKQALENLEQELNLHVQNICTNIGYLEEYKKELHKIIENQALLTVRHLVNQMFFKSEEIFPDKILQQAVENSLNNIPFTTKIMIKVPNAGKNYLNDIDLESKIKNKGISDFSIVEDTNLNSGECEICWDNSGVLSSKKESLTKINNILNTFLSQGDIELSQENLKIENSPTVQKNTVESDQDSEDIVTPETPEQ